MEVTQFTYFQQAGGIECKPVLGEITYGLERLCMYLQNVDNVFDIVWTIGPQGPVAYRAVFPQNEAEQRTYTLRSTARRAGKKCVRPWRSRWSRDPLKKKKQTK